MENFILHHWDNQTNTVARLRTCLLANCVVNAIGLFIASFGNAVILLSIWRTKSLHSPSNTLLFALSLTDLLVGTVTQPLYIITRVYFLVTGKDGPLALMSAFDVISGSLSGVSFITATLISVDRYLVLLLHLRYRCLVTNRRICVYPRLLVVVRDMGIHLDARHSIILLSWVWFLNDMFLYHTFNVLQDISSNQTTSSTNQQSRKPQTKFSLNCQQNQLSELH